MTTWEKYGKLIMIGLATIAMAVFSAVREVAADGTSPSEVVLVVIAGFTALNTWATANLTNWSKAKNIILAVGLVLNLLVSLITNGLTGDEIILLVTQFIGTALALPSPAPVHVTTGAVRTSGGV